MSFFNDEEQIMVSYLDLYTYLGNVGELKHKSMQKCIDYKDDMLFALPYLPFDVIEKGLMDLGLDTNKSYEELICFHRPLCMKFNSKQENSAMIFGSCYVGVKIDD